MLDQLSLPVSDYETVTVGPGVLLWSASKQHLARTSMVKLARHPAYKSLTVRNHNTVFRLQKLLEEAL